MPAVEPEPGAGGRGPRQSDGELGKEEGLSRVMECGTQRGGWGGLQDTCPLTEDCGSGRATRELAARGGFAVGLNLVVGHLPGVSVQCCLLLGAWRAVDVSKGHGQSLPALLCGKWDGDLREGPAHSWHMGT